MTNNINNNINHNNNIKPTIFKPYQRLFEFIEKDIRLAKKIADIHISMRSRKRDHNLDSYYLDLTIDYIHFSNIAKEVIIKIEANNSNIPTVFFSINKTDPILKIKSSSHNNLYYHELLIILEQYQKIAIKALYDFLFELVGEYEREEVKI